MADTESLLHQTYIRRIIFASTILPARRLLSRAYRHLRVLRTMEGVRVSIVLATKVILIFSLVASLGKYVFRIQNPYLFIDSSIENSIAVVYWRSGEK